MTTGRKGGSDKPEKGGPPERSAGDRRDEQSQARGDDEHESPKPIENQLADRFEKAQFFARYTEDATERGIELVEDTARAEQCGDEAEADSRHRTRCP